MNPAEMIKALRSAGVPDHQILDAIMKMDEERRAKGRARVAKHRNNKKNGNVTGVTNVTDVTPSPEGSSPTPPSPNPQPIPPSPPKGGSSPTGFSEFWELFPNKVGKRDAEKAFARAIQRAPLDAIMAGLRRYVAKTDDRPWCNPATFLNQNRWEDQPASAPPRAQAASPPPGRRNFMDVARDRFRGSNDGPESIFGSHSNVELLPARQFRS